MNVAHLNLFKSSCTVGNLDSRFWCTRRRHQIKKNNNYELTCRHYKSTPAFHTPHIFNLLLSLFVCVSGSNSSPAAPEEHLLTVWKLHPLTWQRETSSHYWPHGPGPSPCGAVRGRCGPRLCAVLPLPPLFLPTGDSGALCPDRGGSVWLHLHLHLPGGTDHLNERERNLSLII